MFLVIFGCSTLLNTTRVKITKNDRSWFYYCFGWYIQRCISVQHRTGGWFYHCFEWYIQRLVLHVPEPHRWFYHCFEWYIQL